MKKSSVHLTLVDCPVCKASHSRNVFYVPDYSRSVSENVFGVRQCLKCGCGFLSPRPSHDDMSRYYDDKFYWAWEGGQALSATQLLAARRPQLEAKARFFEHLAPARMLDVGAQKGEFVFWMRERGWDAIGLEFQPLAENPFAVPMRYGDLQTLDWDDETFDCVTMWAVLEHLYDPGSALERVAALLPPKGRLIVLVTNFNSIQARLFRQDDYPRHLTLFTPNSLRSLLKKSGFRTIHMRTTQEVFGGSLHGGLVLLLKRLLGQSFEEIIREWRYSPDPLAFCCKWRGKTSRLIRMISQIDRLLTWIPERVLDRIGFGFVLTVEAERL